MEVRPVKACEREEGTQGRGQGRGWGTRSAYFMCKAHLVKSLMYNTKATKQMS